MERGREGIGETKKKGWGNGKGYVRREGKEIAKRKKGKKKGRKSKGGGGVKEKGRKRERK